MSELAPTSSTEITESIRLARATTANTFVMTANFYLAATTITALGEVVIVCVGTVVAAIVGTQGAWTVYGVGVAFLISNHVVAFAASFALRSLAFVTRRSGGPAAILGGVIAGLLPAVEVLLALPTTFCAAGIQIALWIAVWGLGLASAWRAVKLIRLERQLYDQFE